MRALEVSVSLLFLVFGLINATTSFEATKKEDDANINIGIKPNKELVDKLIELEKSNKDFTLTICTNSSGSNRTVSTSENDTNKESSSFTIPSSNANSESLPSTNPKLTHIIVEFWSELIPEENDNEAPSTLKPRTRQDKATIMDERREIENRAIGKLIAKENLSLVEPSYETTSTFWGKPYEKLKNNEKELEDWHQRALKILEAAKAYGDKQPWIDEKTKTEGCVNKTIEYAKDIVQIAFDLAHDVLKKKNKSWSLF